MSVLGKWRIIELPGYEDDYADVGDPAYILFEVERGEFAFGCVTGAFPGGGEHDAVEFDWEGNDEMDEACGSGWAELLPDGSLQGEICFHRGDDVAFIACRWSASSTAC